MKIVRCYHCTHEWPTKQDRPYRCPKCGAVQWDVPYKRKRGRPRGTDYDDPAQVKNRARVARCMEKKKAVA